MKGTEASASSCAGFAASPLYPARNAATPGIMYYTLRLAAGRCDSHRRGATMHFSHSFWIGQLDFSRTHETFDLESPMERDKMTGTLRAATVYSSS
ncbi:MAG: hypothetical protein QHG99_05875 [Methanomicrobiales archaeon]|jgi:hypothetical protein|nr:hypothetical protein [Methanomicrobiales archaeon]